jgi:CheY-like chemotaxis protein
MEGLDGAQVAEIVKSERKGLKTIIFAYTGDNTEKALDDFKQVGMDGVIVKPIEVENLEMLMTKLEQSNCLDKNTIKLLSKRTNKSILIFDEIDLP